MGVVAFASTEDFIRMCLPVLRSLPTLKTDGCFANADMRTGEKYIEQQGIKKAARIKQ